MAPKIYRGNTSMSLINLQKEVEKVQIILKKKSNKNLQCNVAMNIDVSGSMQSLYDQGQVQKLVERILPVAMSLDDNQTLDVWTFDDGFTKIKQVKEGNYDTFVEKAILKSGIKLWGSTNYAPVLKDNFSHFVGNGGGGGILGGLFSKKKESNEGQTTIVFHVTDGENYDPRETTKLLETWAKDKTPIYLMFIGVGHANFSFIEQAADKYPNCGYTNVKNLTKAVGDDGFYDLLTPQEMIDWLGA